MGLKKLTNNQPFMKKMIKIIHAIIATVIVGLALAVFLVMFVGFIIHINQIAEKNQQKEKVLYNKYEYVIGEKINTGSNITVITDIKIKSNHKIYVLTYDKKEIPISVVEKNIIK